MEHEVYLATAALENSHWWFRGRRAIVTSVLDRLGVGPGAEIVELGCGTGGNLAELARYGRVWAMEPDPWARDVAAGRGCATVLEGSLPDALPFGPRRFDLAVMTDVLEHVGPDRQALAAVRSLLKPGGHLVLTVPAMPSLWSSHDEAHHHQRRYRAADLRAKLIEAGFEPPYLSHFNFVLMPTIVIARLAERVLRPRHGPGGTAHDLNRPPTLLNGILTRVFAAERHVVVRLPLPIGVSILAIARTPAAPQASAQRLPLPN